MLKRRHPRPSLALLDKLFRVIARRIWSGWKQALLVVTPETGAMHVEWRPAKNRQAHRTDDPRGGKGSTLWSTQTSIGAGNFATFQIRRSLDFITTSKGGNGQRECGALSRVPQ
jgi:hypothetical protein